MNSAFISSHNIYNRACIISGWFEPFDCDADDKLHLLINGM